MADKDFDFNDDDEREREPSPRDRPRDPNKGKLTPTKLALIIWVPIAGVLLLAMLGLCLYVGVIVYAAQNQPHEPNPLTGR